MVGGKGWGDLPHDDTGTTLKSPIFLTTETLLAPPRHHLPAKTAGEKRCPHAAPKLLVGLLGRNFAPDVIITVLRIASAKSPNEQSISATWQ